jgi:hypothetical protein
MMNKKVWVPIGYVVLVLVVFYATSQINASIMEDWHNHYDYMHEVIPRLNTISMMFSLIVTVYLFLTLKHIFYMYPPLRVLFVSEIIIVLLGGISYITFNSVENYNAALLVFYGLTFISGLIALIIHIVLIFSLHTTKAMKYCLIPVVIIGLLMNVFTTGVQIGSRIGFFDDIQELLIVQSQVNLYAFIVRTVLVAMWFHLMLREEENGPKILEQSHFS